jgi:nitrogen PTS system EIIA component
MKFNEFIQADAIVASLVSPDRDGVIRELVHSLARVGAIEVGSVDAIVKAMLDRENSGTTGFGLGVAAPHCKHPQVARLMGTVGMSARGVDFKSRDGKPVYAVFMLLSPQGHENLHLKAMETVFCNLNREAFRRALRQADTTESVVALLAEADMK